MPGGGRRWKTLVSRYRRSKLDVEFSTVAHRPWKSQTARFPHFHSADYFSFSLEMIRPAPFGRSQKGGPGGSLRSRLQAHVA